ncbi:UNVERIFIED_CONTAM: hypothetical protein Sradi_1233900 [Sesamum radiatum]|uniref:Uncharacterized protein n=1 Tax=Sesamum radiatum TaxID=300843 RepID=A0AAW2UMH4_SESRA
MHMAAPRSYFGRSNYRFLPIDHGLTNDAIVFELEESDVWNSGALSPSPELRKSSSRVYRKRSAGVRVASLPVNVPDWSKKWEGGRAMITRRTKSIFTPN